MIYMMIMNMLMTLIFMFMNHPMSMGLILLIQTILISMMSGMLSYTFWFSYIVFLVMLGGMLVLFIYMTSLASNEMFQFSSKISLFLMMMIMLFTFIMFMLPDNQMMFSMIKNSNLLEINNSMMFLNNENLITLNKIYNSPNNLITILLINYLLITLIAVVKITSISIGPLRQKF
uniref:NADH dehydrogenase subunit 6 n=1 Tax=Calomera brevipilosa TaxID=2976104 RepID=UPI00223710FB|nr:NADH dehydrogenase subunit 6 [Calomera brevipilosa]UYK51604.1 NADH dehydrogenase subunit 6 [Calomera brevipilosa]